jgi:phage terminase small subunit
MEEQAQVVKLLKKEQVFADTYLITLNKSEAARAAGYSKLRARQEGYELYNKAHIKAYIESRLKESALSADETVKLISDAAVASVTNYYRPVKVERIERVKKGLQQLIDELRAKMEFEDNYALEINMEEEELMDHMKSQESRRRQIIRYKLELKSNPKAYRIVDSTPELVDEMQLDINALVADKEHGKVKKIKYGMAGIEVEMYDAAAAQDKLMKMHGKYEKDNEQSKVTVNPTTNITVVSSGIPLANSEKDVSDV